MSYILEALRRAERERNPAQAESPRIESRTRFAAQISNLQKLRQYRPLLVAGLCFSLMIAVTTLLISRRHQPVANDDAVASPALLPAVAEQAPSHDGYASLLKQVYGEGNGPATLDDLVDAGGDPNTDELTTYNDTDATTHLGEAAIPASSDSADEAFNTTPTPAPAPSRPAPVTTVERVRLDPAPPPQIPRLNEMPSDYRAAFPTISLDVHSYDSAPQKRFIMIAGRRYNEGDSLPEGARVVQIIPDGVVFDFRGEQVLFSISH